MELEGLNLLGVCLGTQVLAIRPNTSFSDMSGLGVGWAEPHVWQALEVQLRDALRSVNWSDLKEAPRAW